MKIKGFIFFILGVVVGIVFSWRWSKWDAHEIESIDIALGELFYEELMEYPKQWKVDNITQVMKDLSLGRLAPQEHKERDQVLVELASRKSERIAQDNLFKANAYLIELSSKKGDIFLC